MKLRKAKDIPAGEIAEQLVTRPAEMFDMVMNYADKLQRTILPWQPAIIDRMMVPLYEGQYIIMQGRPGDAKTSLGLALGNIMGLAIAGMRDFPYGNPLFVTAETTQQHMAMYLAMERLNAMGKLNSVTGKAWNIEDVHRGRYKRNELALGAMKLAGLHMNTLGQHADKIGHAIDVDIVFRAVQELEKSEGKRPAFIIMDYAQKMDAMSIDGVKSSNDKDAKIFTEVDQFCVATGIPVLLMAQSNEWVDDLDVPIGTPGSVHGTSFAHRYAHAHLALMRPWNKKQYREGDLPGQRPVFIDTKWGKYPLRADLQIVRKLKMRGADPLDNLDEIGFYFNVGRMTIEEIPEMVSETIDLNDAMNYTEEQLMGMAQGGFEFA